MLVSRCLPAPASQPFRRSTSTSPTLRRRLRLRWKVRAIDNHPRQITYRCDCTGSIVSVIRTPPCLSERGEWYIYLLCRHPQNEKTRSLPDRARAHPLTFEPSRLSSRIPKSCRDLPAVKEMLDRLQESVSHEQIIIGNGAGR